MKLASKYFKKNHAHISWKFFKHNKERGFMFFNWRLTTFYFGVHIGIGKSGINIDIGFWGNFGFYYCWAKLKTDT